MGKQDEMLPPLASHLLSPPAPCGLWDEFLDSYFPCSTSFLSPEFSGCHPSCCDETVPPLGALTCFISVGRCAPDSPHSPHHDPLSLLCASLHLSCPFMSLFTWVLCSAIVPPLHGFPLNDLFLSSDFKCHQPDRSRLDSSPQLRPNINY